MYWKKSYKFGLLLGIACLTLSSQCGQETVVPVTNSLTITTQHHEQIVANIPVYIVYNSVGFPGYTDINYDTVLVTGANGKAFMENIPEGKHWCIGLGFDSDIQDSVKGSASIWIQHPRQSVDTLIRVTEIH